MSDVSNCDRGSTIVEFLAATAARRPTPGGGSVTALVGALAAAIGEMTLNYSIGRKNAPQADPVLKPLLAEFEKAREMLLQLMVEDQQAYRALTELHRLPPDAPQRAELMAAAVLTCIRVPQAIAATAAAIVELCHRAVEQVNPRLISDWAVCAELAMATLRCGIYNVRVNLNDVKQEADRKALLEATDRMTARAVEHIRQVMPRIWERHAELSKAATS